MNESFPEELRCQYCNYLRQLLNERELKYERKLLERYEHFKEVVAERDLLRKKLEELEK